MGKGWLQTMESGVTIPYDSTLEMTAATNDTAAVRARHGEGRMSEVAALFIVGDGIGKDDGCAVMDFHLSKEFIRNSSIRTAR